MTVLFENVANSDYYLDFDEIIVELSRLIDIENDYVIVKINDNIFKVTTTDIERL